jgi:lipid-binding SYLF domain-containing protein
MVKVRVGAGLLALVLLAAAVNARPAAAASAASIDRSADAALADLYAGVPEAQEIARRARGILVFPGIVKAGFLFGAQYGEGALRREGRTVGYYNSVAASYGLQAGVQSFGYVLFFMTDSALRYLDQSQGFEIGTGPSVVILDVGAAKTFTTTTLQHDVYAFVFDQRGLMAGVGLQGSKISRIER